MNCPYCGGVVDADVTVCPDCHEDLSALAHLEQQHLILYNQGLGLAKAGRLDMARDKLLASLACSPDYVSAQRLLAKVYAAQGDWAHAEKAALRAAELNPDDIPTRKLLDQAHAKAHRTPVVQRQDAGTRRQAAEGILESYQQDVMGAFAIGAGLAAAGAVLLSLIGRGRREA